MRTNKLAQATVSGSVGEFIQAMEYLAENDFLLLPHDFSHENISFP